MDAHDTHAEFDVRFAATPAEGATGARLRDRDEPFGVPSRFGIGTLLVVTAAYGALLSLLLALRFNRGAIAWIVVFVSLVGLAQMLLFGARRPRKASLVAGVIALPALAVAASIVHEGARSPPVCGLVCVTMFGAPAGYLAGAIVAGVFLVMDAVDRGLKRLKR